MRRIHRRAGFTLIEIIVVIGLMGVVTTIGCVMFSRMFSATSVLTERVELDNKAEAVFKTLRRDFDQILSVELSGVPMRGVFENASDDRSAMTLDKVLDNDRVIIPVQRAAGGAEEDQAGKVMYWIDRQGGEPTLVRTHGTLDEAEPKKARTIVQPGVVRMRIEYAPKDSEAWLRDQGWDRDDLPGAVRVSLTIVGDHPLEQVSRKAVFPINVN
ncbi:MAG TPA: type II secretion system protein [Candidatus Hydrogenedentes bacterium]|nr:type II secretion system protein [Candidatus Hydrogenedentota bacterium]HIJ73961.1 type II secretion system protein [Candidatus Hydrogenedentota bacterium]